MSPREPVAIPFQQYELDNGLNVILHEDHALPQVTVNLWYRVGSKDEQPGRSGFAHLFEHLMFMGTTRVPGSGFDDRMEAEGGRNNAWASDDDTDYYSVGPSNLLELLLWLDADRMEGLGKAMTQEKLDVQRDVVRNERRQSYEDAPYGPAWLALNELMFPPDHPYAHPTIGSHEDLAAATLADVKAFFDAWYVPGNASLAVAGDFDPPAAREMIARLFGSIADRPVPDRRAAVAPDLPARPLLVLEDEVQIPKTILAWHSPAALSPGDAELDLVGSILAQGRSSRLYRRLVRADQAALEVSAGQWSQQLGSLFVVTALAAEGHLVEELEDAVAQELARLVREGPSDAELSRVKNLFEVEFLRKLEKLQTRATTLNRYWALTGDPGWVQRDLERYRQATAAGVRDAAARLTLDRRAVLRVLPAAAPEER